VREKLFERSLSLNLFLEASRCFLDEFHYFIILRKTMFFMFGEEHFSLVHHIKDSSAGPDQFGANPEFFFQILRQTGGSRLIVSTTAIGYFAFVHFTYLASFSLLGTPFFRILHIQNLSCKYHFVIFYRIRFTLATRFIDNRAHPISSYLPFSV
jgi:hypothetical protein